MLGSLKTQRTQMIYSELTDLGGVRVVRPYHEGGRCGHLPRVIYHRPCFHTKNHPEEPVGGLSDMIDVGRILNIRTVVTKP